MLWPDEKTLGVIFILFGFGGALTIASFAIKRVLVRQLDELMRREEISKTELATRMKTSRAQLDRLLDPENESVTLGTLTRAAQAVGRHLRMELV